MGSQTEMHLRCDLQEARSPSEGRGRQRVSRCWRGIHGCGGQRNERGRQELAAVHVGASLVDHSTLHRNGKQEMIHNGFRAPAHREVEPAYAVSFKITTSVILSPVRMALTTAMS